MTVPIKPANRIKEWFTTMVKGLAAQGWLRSFDQIIGACVYSNKNGFKCPVGFILPKNSPMLSDNECEQCSVGALFRHGKLSRLSLGNISTEELMFLQSVQSAHDSSEIPEQMREAFKNLATVYSLDFDAILSEDSKAKKKKKSK